MTHAELKAGRLKAGLTQVQAARRLGVSQPYLSQLEKGDRAATTDLLRKAATLYRLSPTSLPLPERPNPDPDADSGRLAEELAGLGYPGFAHLRARKANPAVVLLDALVRPDLAVRLTEALPWVAFTYSDLDWAWLLQQTKLRDAQNRLGFVVAVAGGLATRRLQSKATARLSAVEQELEHARLAREDTLCRESMPVVEREWLVTTRSPLAKHWNLLTGLTSEQLPYAA